MLLSSLYKKKVDKKNQVLWTFAGTTATCTSLIFILDQCEDAGGSNDFYGLNSKMFLFERTQGGRKSMSRGFDE